MTKARGAGTSGLQGKTRRTAARRRGGTRNATCVARTEERAAVSTSHGTQHGAVAAPGGRQHPDSFGWQAAGAAPAFAKCALLLEHWRVRGATQVRDCTGVLGTAPGCIAGGGL